LRIELFIDSTDHVLLVYIYILLLSLLPPSCMVVSIRELVNKSLSSTTKTLSTKKISPNNDVEMVINPIDDLFNNCNNYDEVRGCTLASSMHCPRSLSLFSSDSKEDYVTRV